MGLGCPAGKKKNPREPKPAPAPAPRLDAQAPPTRQTRHLPLPLQRSAHPAGQHSTRHGEWATATRTPTLVSSPSRLSLPQEWRRGWGRRRGGVPSSGAARRVPQRTTSRGRGHHWRTGSRAWRVERSLRPAGILQDHGKGGIRRRRCVRRSPGAASTRTR